MKVVRRWVRSILMAAIAVTGSVTANQVLNGGSLNVKWLTASLVVFILAETLAETVGPRLTDARSVSSTTRRRTLLRKRHWYLRQLRRGVRDMETVGIATQSEFVLRLSQVYVDVSLVPQPPQDTADEPIVGMIETAPAERRSLQSFLDRSDGQVFTAIGGPGSGKTTLVRRTALDLCRWSPRRRPLPMVVYLRDHAAAILSESPPGLAAIAASAGWTNGKINTAWFERRLDGGHCLVMLDGLDEVADEGDRARVVGWAEAQIKRFPRNDYLITSRPHGYLSNPLPSANVLQVRRFTGEQVSMFLHNWYYAIECHAIGTTGKAVREIAARKADDLLARLRRQPALYDLAASPLLLTMIANVHRYRDALPGSRAALYAEMCEVLVHRRQESKGLTDPTGLRGPQKEHVVCALAWTMMTKRVRDIPEPDACAAVESVLSQVSRAVTPGEFLDEVRKSGLLVEREHGVYAFAHLTLQEYLAATHIGDPDQIDRLARAVDDPWWRETTLLWAAGADATPIIKACLASGTVRALSLAFDCADEALKVDPDVARSLENRLTSPSTEGNGHDRLITAVKAARILRDVIWLGEGTTMCARPVGRDLYAMFTRDERAAGRHTPDPGGDHDEEADAQAPATGMWSSDAARFVTWLNALFDAGTSYRLPTPAELTDPAVGLVTGLAERSIWVEAVPRPRLHRPGGVSCPYTPEPGWLGRATIADRKRMTPYLRLAVATGLPLDLDRVATYSRGLTRALAFAPVVGDHPDLRIHELVLNLVFAHTLSSGREPGEHLDVDLALDLALGFTGALTRSGSDPHDDGPGAPPVPDRHLVLARALGIPVPFERLRVKPRAVKRAYDLAAELDLDTPHELSRLAGEADRIDVLRDVLSRVADSGARDADALSITGGDAPAVETALARADAFARDARRTHRDAAPAPVPALAPALALALENDLGGDDGLLLDLDPAPGAATLKTAMLTVDGLFRLWTPSRSRRSRTGALLADFDAFLANLVAEPGEPKKIAVPEDPAIALQRARALMSAPPRRPVPEQEGWRQAILLAEQAEKLITPVLGRTARCAELTMACARMALLTAAALAREVRRDDAAAHLLEALRGLAALRERTNGDLVPNEVLILVRI